MNNYEKIKSMSIDEMAELLAPCVYCMYEKYQTEKCEECIDDVKQMLLRESEE